MMNDLQARQERDTDTHDSDTDTDTHDSDTHDTHRLRDMYISFNTATEAYTSTNSLRQAQTKTDIIQLCKQKQQE